MSYKQTPIYDPEDRVRIRDTLVIGRVWFAAPDVDGVIQYAIRYWTPGGVGGPAHVIVSERELENAT